MDVALPPVFYAIVLSAGFVFFFWMGEDVHLEAWRRALLATVAVAIYVTIAIALYGFLEPIGSRLIVFQGRYLVPVWLLLSLSVYGTRFVQRHRAAPFLVGVLLLMMAVNLGTIVSSYYL
jgi:predicted Co/Zn/Cd cation transporter (cation efflux family)